MTLRKIANYTITRELGRGGMGAVYQALSPEGATVALKTVLWPENVDPRGRWETIERFQREARAARSLTHPNICHVLDFGADEDSLYIVIEFLDGETLSDLIALAGGIKLARAVEIVCAVGEALGHAHDHGIIHRDVKPGNIMVLRDSRVKLTDFGLASVLREMTLTSSHGAMGTLYYMSPEQVRGEKLDARSDIFSLGFTCYEMLTGERAFRAEEPAAVMNQILTNDPPPVPGLPSHLSQVLQKCLRKDPNQRFQSARELINSLSAAATATAPTSVLPDQPWRTPVEAPGVTPAETFTARNPPPPLDTPEAEEADVRRRANFRYPEDFEGGLEWFAVGRTDWGMTTVEGDALVLTGAPSPFPGAPYPYWSDFRGAIAPCEFVIEARITRREGRDSWPLGFFSHALPVDAYMFTLTGNGAVSIGKMSGGRMSGLGSVEGATEVNQGNAENLLKVVRRHGRLHIFVNHQHVLTAEDFDLGAMTLAPFIRSGVKAAFSDIRVQGISMRGVLYDIDKHMANLETRKAKEKLDYLRLYAPLFVAPDFERALRSPDRSATVLVTLRSGARLTRGGDAPAKRLVDTINAKGANRPFHWATDVTETELESDEAYLECPLITIGDPGWGGMARRLKDELPRDREVSTDEILIYHDIGHGERRVALWGQNTKTDMDAVELFISSGLLDKFLARVWEEE